jgi:hypothetical protein
MRTLVACAAAVSILSGVAEASAALKAVVGSYLEIQAQLAADKVEGLEASATALSTAAASLGKPGEAIVAAARVLGQAADLEAAREAFGPLSDAVIAAAKAEEWKGLDDVKVAYCPMVNRSWLQKGDSIRNPFYGSAMLTCGEIQGKF